MSPIIVDDVVKHILTSKVYDVAEETPPLSYAPPRLSKEKGCSVYLKREDLQSIHSFKLRGEPTTRLPISAMRRKIGGESLPQARATMHRELPSQRRSLALMP